MTDPGFTLVEALVAMAVLGLASVGLVRATQAHVDLIGGVRDRAAARWVAENRLAEFRVGLPAPASVTMLGRSWRVTTRAGAGGDPGLEAIDVVVAVPGGPPLVTLRSFRATGDRR